MQKRADGATETKWGESGTELVADPAERMVVEQMQAARAEGLTLRAIAEMLNREKVPCKRGGAKSYGSTARLAGRPAGP
jgi:alkylated DNA nucleotide flippase Atl1